MFWKWQISTGDSVPWCTLQRVPFRSHNSHFWDLMIVGRKLSCWFMAPITEQTPVPLGMVNIFPSKTLHASGSNQWESTRHVEEFFDVCREPKIKLYTQPKNWTDRLAKSCFLLEMYQHASNMAVIFWYWYFFFNFFQEGQWTIIFLPGLYEWFILISHQKVPTSQLKNNQGKKRNGRKFNNNNKIHELINNTTL